MQQYSNSGDTDGDKTPVVGYGAVAFYGEERMQNRTDNRQALTPEQGAALVALARQTLVRHFGETIAPTDPQRLET